MPAMVRNDSNTENETRINKIETLRNCVKTCHG